MKNDNVKLVSISISEYQPDSNQVLIAAIDEQGCTWMNVSDKYWRCLGQPKESMRRLTKRSK